MIKGCIHGRFQPFHNGHLEYLLAAYALSDQLIIGITQYEPSLVDEKSPQHRLNQAENPFSYRERVEIIKAALLPFAIDMTRISFSPFPIHRPNLIENYIDSECIMFTTICDAWNLEKIERLQRAGFAVKVLWEREDKKFEGKIVRDALKIGDTALEKMVPPGAIDLIRTLYQRHNLKMETLNPC